MGGKRKFAVLIQGLEAAAVMKARTRLAAILGLVGGLAAAAWLYDRHHFTVGWPSEVQQETVGGIVATAGALRSKERHFAYGEGFARWTYDVEASGPVLRHLCGEVEVSRCSFSRSRRVTEGVVLYVALSGGVLTVEEWWS